MHPPLHPNCRCTLALVHVSATGEESEEEQDDEDDEDDEEAA